tara:strand:+ start:226 stop:384 length:159 start_codon:yes stop_codon:yes gene_type:complete
MLKNAFLYISLAFIFYFSISDSLLKSQKIDCNNGVQLACSYLDASQKQNKDI